MRRLSTVEAPLGGKEVFELLYRAQRASVYGFLLARSGDPSLAEELTAETFVAAWQRLQDMESGSASIEPGWLIVVARRRLIDYWRRSERLRVRLLQLAAEYEHAAFVDATDGDEQILRALASLPERQRAVIVLRYLDGHAVSEIADLLDMTYKTVESLLSRGRRSLRAAYEEVQR